MSKKLFKLFTRDGRQLSATWDTLDAKAGFDGIILTDHNSWEFKWSGDSKYLWDSQVTRDIYDEQGFESPVVAGPIGEDLHIRDLLVGETWEDAIPYVEWEAQNMVDSEQHPEHSSLVQSTKFVEATSLVPEGWDSFWGVISDEAPFAWGCNNRTLVTASDFKRYVEKRLEVPEPDYDSGDDEWVECALEDKINHTDYLVFMHRLEMLGEIYVDLEN